MSTVHVDCSVNEQMSPKADIKCGSHSFCGYYKLQGSSNFHYPNETNGDILSIIYEKWPEVLKACNQVTIKLVQPRHPINKTSTVIWKNIATKLLQERVLLEYKLRTAIFPVSRNSRIPDIRVMDWCRRWVEDMKVDLTAYACASNITLSVRSVQCAAEPVAMGVSGALAANAVLHKILDQDSLLDSVAPLVSWESWESSKPLFSGSLDPMQFFIVGAGATGCESLLLLANMLSHPRYRTRNGKPHRIVVVDGDTIELSNLNRQVLYKPEDIGHFKAAVAVEALKRLGVVSSQWIAEAVVDQVTEKTLANDGLAIALSDADAVLSCVVRCPSCVVYLQ